MAMTHGKATAALQKLFIIDEDGAYAGEYAIDEECAIEFDDFVRAVGNMAIADYQTVFIGESKATMLHGTHLSLIAVSRGPLSSQELIWAKAALIAVEAVLVQESKKEGHEPVEEHAPDVSEEDLAEKNADNRFDELRKQLSEVEFKLEREKELNSETSTALQSREDKLREMEATASAAKDREEKLRKDIDILRSNLDSVKAKIPEDFAQAQKDIELRVKILQKKAFELLEREEKLRKKEQELSETVASE